MSRRASVALVLCIAAALVAPVAGSAPLEAQYRRDPGPPALRLKPHEVDYIGILEVVGIIGEQEQYRVGPDTLRLGVAVSGEGNDMMLDFSLDVGDGPSTGSVEISELGFEVARYWRPALEMLTLLSILPLTEEPVAVGGEWQEITGYTIAELGLEFAEATRFRIESIEDGVATIAFSAEGGGSTTIDRPQLGRGARMEVSRESAREGRFVFSIEEGRVLEATRLERITNSSVVYQGDDATVGPDEVQSLTLRLVPAGN